jgi:hypothetical protein
MKEAQNGNMETLIGSWLWITITKHGFHSQLCKHESIIWIQSTPCSATQVSSVLLLLWFCTNSFSWFCTNSFSIHSALKITPLTKASGVKLELLEGYEMTSPCPPPTPSSDPLSMDSGDVEQHTLTCEIRMPSSDTLLLHTCELYCTS